VFVTESSEPTTGRSSSGVGHFNAKIVEEYRANGGKLGGMFAGSDLLLLHHTGAKTGTERVYRIRVKNAPRKGKSSRKAA